MKHCFRIFIICLGTFPAAAQNVGIGTTTPLERLSVVSTDGYGISHERASIKLSTFIDGSSAYFGTVSDHPFHLYTNNGSAQFTLLQNGFVGIGNINPQYRLDVVGRMRVRTGSAGDPFTSSGIWMDDYRDGSQRIFLGMQDSIRLGVWGEGTPGAGWALNFNARNGNVGIGVTNPTNKLAVAGNISATGALSAGGDVSGNAFEYNSPQTRYYSISSADFTSRSTHMINDNSDISWFDPLVYNYGSYAGDATFVAPVHLPDGATVTEVTAYLFDNSNSDDLVIRLQRKLHENDTYITMCTLQSSGTPGNTELTTTSISFPVIANQYYNFTVFLGGAPAWDNDLEGVRAVRIKYTVMEAQ